MVLGAVLASAWGTVGAALHIVMHAFGKITLFFCAGAVLVTAHKTEVSELGGLGRRMPVTMGAFVVALDRSAGPEGMDTPGFRLHRLKGRMRGHHAVSVSGRHRLGSHRPYRLQPAARASDSVQNHRSPREVLIRVRA